MLNDEVNAKPLIKEFFLYLFIFWMIMGAVAGKTWVFSDEQVDYFGHAHDLYFCVGRWGIVLYKLIFGIGTITWSAICFAGIYSSITIILQVRLFRLATWLPKCILASFLLGSFTLNYYVVFTHHMDSLCCGFLLGTLAVWILVRSDGSMLMRIVGSSMLLCLAISVYQSIAFYFGVVSLVFFLSNFLLKGKAIPVKMLVALLITSMLGCAIWYIITAWTRSWELDPEQVLYAQNYHKAISIIDQLPELSLDTQLLLLLQGGKRLAYHALGLSGHYIYASLFIPLFYLLYLGVRINRDRMRRLQVVLCLVGVFVASYCTILVVTDIHSASTRSLIAAPLALGALWAVAWTERSRRRPISQSVQMVTMLLLFFHIAKASYNTTLLQRSVAYAYEVSSARLSALEASRQEMSRKAGKELTMLFVYASKENELPTTAGRDGELASHLEFWYMRNWNHGKLPAFVSKMPLYPDYASIQPYGEDALIVKLPTSSSDRNQMKRKNAVAIAFQPEEID